MLRQIEECISVPHEKAPALRNAAGAFEGTSLGRERERRRIEKGFRTEGQ